jgi:hypothetical protein
MEFHRYDDVEAREWLFTAKAAEPLRQLQQEFRNPDFHMYMDEGYYDIPWGVEARSFSVTLKGGGMVFYNLVDARHLVADLCRLAGLPDDLEPIGALDRLLALTAG